MERTNKSVQKKDDGKVAFIKKGKGMLRLADGRVVKSGEVFRAYPENIPHAFRDTIVLHEVDEKKQEVFKEHGVVESDEPSFEIKQVAAGWFDIVDKQDKPINEKKMRKDEAEDMLKDLEGKL